MTQGTCLAMFGGRLVVVKQAAPGAGSARLHHEATCLRRAAHPGVIELVDVDDSASTSVMRTAFVGGTTLAEWSTSGLGLGPTTRLAASLAATLADLHHRGITHGRISADHVLAADGGAVVCGFAAASVVEAGGTSSTAHRAAAAADVAAVGALIQELSGDGVRPGSSALVSVATRASAPDPSARPSMRAVADALQGLIDDAPGVAGSEHLGRRLLPRATDPRSAPWLRLVPSRLAPTVGVVAALMVAGIVGFAVLTPSPGPGDREGLDTHQAAPAPPSPSPPLLPTSTTPGPPSASPKPATASHRAPAAAHEVVRVWPPPACEVAPRSPPETGQPTADFEADIDGDGCADEVHLDDGVLGSGGHRWEVARAGDVVVVGDWDCDEIATPMVLRPGSGEVWRYPRWAAEGEEVAAVLVTTVPGAVDATVEPARERRPGCERLTVLDTTGTSTPVDGVER